jgi:broad specificity phosphatase PhoE
MAPFREIGMGRWEGLTFAEIRAREPELCDRWLAEPFAIPFPDGEALTDVQARALPAIRTLVERHGGGRIAVFAHGGTNRVILGAALGLPLANILRLAQDYAAWSLIEYRDGTAVVHSVNQRPPGPPGTAPLESMLSRQRRP